MADQAELPLETSTENPKPFKWASLHKKNRRILILVYDTKENGIVILVQTRRLVDFKTRNIMTTDISYGLETFLALATIYDTLAKDLEFLKVINPELGKLNKDRYTCNSNFIRK